MDEGVVLLRCADVEGIHGGKICRSTKADHEVVMMVTQGHRLYRPQKAAPHIYSIMKMCWMEVTTESFTASLTLGTSVCVQDLFTLMKHQQDALWGESFVIMFHKSVVFFKMYTCSKSYTSGF